MADSLPHRASAPNRREFLARAGAGCGALAWAALEGSRAARGDTPASPRRLLAPREPHFPAKVKRLIWLFADGGASHLDLFDYKPELTKLAGKPLPAHFKRPRTTMGSTAHTPLLATKRKFARYGQSGAWMSDWLPYLQKQADDLTILAACRGEGSTHVGGCLQMNTGALIGGRPSLGAWSLYGLGCETEELPGFVVLTDNGYEPPGGSQQWGTGFMPAAYQGTRLLSGKTPIVHLAPALERSERRQKESLDFIQQLNRGYAGARPDDDQLEARIAAYELAFRMQGAAPEAVDLAGETAETHRLYGLDQETTAQAARSCLLARRLVERGVRCVQVYLGTGSGWDAHTDIESNHSKLCAATDQPVAALLADLKRRGLLEETLVVWAGEFGRTPMSESGHGRDHNPFGFTIWLAGAGLKSGITYGATDEIGLYAVEGKVHVHDLHATLLHLLGLNHETLTYFHNGRDERLTITEGRLVKEILS